MRAFFMVNLQVIRRFMNYFINLDQIQIANEKSTSHHLRPSSHSIFKPRAKR